MDEPSIADVNSHMKRFLPFDLKIDKIGRAQILGWDGPPDTNQVMCLTRKNETHRMAVDIMDKPAAVKPLRCRPPETVWRSQQQERSPYDTILSGCHGVVMIV
jgi:hypothetical protein